MRRCIEINDARGGVAEPGWLAAAEGVHRQLRDKLPASYATRMAEVFANGARMSVLADGEKVVGVAVWRILENTFEGRRCYIDDLVTDSAARSTGVGEALLAHVERIARAAGCVVLALDSGVQRGGAHKFYFREDMQIFAYSFRKALR
jgi:GNAT superfamily N-acetyltransferase